MPSTENRTIDECTAIRTAHRPPQEGRLHLLWPVYLYPVLLTTRRTAPANVFEHAVSQLRGWGLSTPEAISDALTIPVPLARRLLEQREPPKQARQRFVAGDEVLLYAIRDSITGESTRRMLPSSVPVLPMERTEKPHIRRLPRAPGDYPLKMHVVRAPVTDATPMGGAEARDCWGELRTEDDTMRAMAPSDAPLQVLSQVPAMRLVHLAIVPDGLMNLWTVWDSVTGRRSLRWRSRIERLDIAWLTDMIAEVTQQDSYTQSLAMEEACRRGIHLDTLPSGISEQVEQLLLLMTTMKVDRRPSHDAADWSESVLATGRVLNVILLRSLSNHALPRLAIQEIKHGDLAGLIGERLSLDDDSVPDTLRENPEGLTQRLRERRPRDLRALTAAVALSAAFNSGHPLRSLVRTRPDVLMVWDALAGLQHDHARWNAEGVTLEEPDELCWDAVALGAQILAHRSTGEGDDVK